MKSFPLANFESFHEVKIGMMISADNGAQGTIIEVDDNSVKIDFNHQLAGKTLIFEVTVVSINE